MRTEEKYQTTTSKYHFETDEFGVSDKGIHLLRSRFNYETFEFNQINTITIARGKELNNWLVILIIGIAMFSFSIFYLWRLYHVLFGEQTYGISFRQILIPVIPFMLGGYCLYTSTRNSIVMRVKTAANKSRKFSLKELEKNGELQAFKKFLKEKLGATART